LQIVGEDGQVVGESIGPLSRPDYPPTQWESGQLIMGKADIVVPADIKEGPYRLQLSLLPPESDQALRVNWALGRRYVPLGVVLVEPWPLLTDLPPIPEEMNAVFGQPPIIELHGYGLSINDSLQDTGSLPTPASPGDLLDLTLFWRSISDDIPTGYTVFVHLVNNDESIIAQGDGSPVGGFRPTTSWRSGEVIIDDHSLSIPPDTPVGIYRLWIGLFDPETGQRLPVTVAGEQLPDGRLLLQSIQVR
jgi:hypothetical protein